MKCPFVIKVCTKCGEILIANSMNFVKMKKGKYGLNAYCKKCKNQCNKEYYENNKEYYKEYRENNKEEIKEYKKEYYENNKEEIKEKHKEYNKEYYENNKEKHKEYNKEYYENNKEKRKEYNKEYYENNKEYYKEYRENNKEEIKEYKKEYYENNPHIAFNATSRRRQKLESQGEGLSREQWFEMMEFFDWKCAYSGTQLNKNNRSTDHIIPLDKNGENEVWNCVPMIRNYNSSKQDKDMLEWYKQQEFYSEERLNKIYEWIEYAFEKWGNQ